MDEFAPPVVTTTQALENVATNTFMNSTIGDYGISNTFTNKGAYERSLFTALDQNSGKLAYDMASTNANLQAVSKPQVWTSGTAAVAAGAPFYVAHYLACIKLKDICDYFKKCPMQKNTRGFIYINYNSSATTIVTDTTLGVFTPACVSTISNNMNFGNTCPILWNFNSMITGSSATGNTGLSLPGTTATTLTITADINGTPNSLATISPSQTFSRLLVPTYTPNPSADHALVQKKTFRYFERVTNRFVVNPLQYFTWTISNGITNPKKLILQPVVIGAFAATTETLGPFRNPFSTIPVTCSPFARLKKLQCTLGNIPIWNNPVSFGYDLFLQEMQKLGLNGGFDDATSTGLLSQRQWESLYRFVAIDIGCRLPSEDGASKSIVISGTSNCNYPLAIYYHVWREVVATVDTAMGTVSQGPVQH